MSTKQEVDNKLSKLNAFKSALRKHEETGDIKIREWLNQEVAWVRGEVIEAGCFSSLTVSPPPAIGGLVLRNIDPFDMMFERPYLMSLVPTICDMIDKTIGFLRNPPNPKRIEQATVKVDVKSNYAFVAMPMDKEDHQLVDVLEAIKDTAQKCGIVAERVDDTESNERITDRILQSIGRAEYVIVDLTKEKPNVFFEAGYAQGLGKTPIYIARSGTLLHFDIKDYPVIMFRNIKELKEGLIKRLVALSTPSSLIALTKEKAIKVPTFQGGLERAGGQQLRFESQESFEPIKETFKLQQRVFHEKFGYGRISEIDGNKLTVDFEKAGQKKVVASFVEGV